MGPQQVTFDLSLPTPFEEAETLIFEEVQQLVTADAFDHPLKNVKPPRERPELEKLNWNVLQKIKAEIENEAIIEFGSLRKDDLMDVDDNEELFMYVPKDKKYQEVASLSITDQVGSLRNEFESIKGHMEKDIKKVQKMEHKAGLLINGHIGMTKKTQTRIEEQFNEKIKLFCELSGFEQLQKQEEIAVKNRMEELEKMVNKERERNN